MVRSIQRLPPLRLRTVSSDYRLSVSGCEVWITCGSGRIFLCCRGFVPTRVFNNNLHCDSDKVFRFECDTFDECVREFLNLSKECLRRFSYI